MRFRRSLRVQSIVFVMITVCVILSAGIACSDGEKDIDAAINALNDNDAYRAIVPADAEPRLLLDGEVSEPGLTFTEGPSWMNGALYFSNYYKFWKEWGSSDEGGLIRLTRDGRHTVLNRNVQTCGTMISGWTFTFSWIHSAAASKMARICIL